MATFPFFYGITARSTYLSFGDKKTCIEKRQMTAKQQSNALRATTYFTYILQYNHKHCNANYIDHCQRTKKTNLDQFSPGAHWRDGIARDTSVSLHSSTH